MEAFDPDQVVGADEDPRVREQDWGNYQDASQMRKVRDERSTFGSFYYRCPNGESGSDVYDRVSVFLESLNRYWTKNRDADTLIIVSHGLFCRLFLMRYMKWSVSFFESLWNLNNAEWLELVKVEGGRFQLISQLPGVDAAPTKKPSSLPPHMRKFLADEAADAGGKTRKRSDTMFG